MVEQNDNSNYSKDAKIRLEELREDIERLRDELQKVTDTSGYLCTQDKTYTISNKLDSLILQFIKAKEEIDGK